jgi:predicted dehydrogenase
MEVYGEKGVIYADDRQKLRVRISEGYDGYTEEVLNLEERDPPFDDPFALFSAVIRKELVLQPYDPYTLENNMIVMEILEAARKSETERKTIQLKK